MNPYARRGTPILRGHTPVPSVNRIEYATVTPSPLPGSSLKSLAQIHYRDGAQWPRIFEANHAGTRRADGTPGLIENPNSLRAGWRLIIP